MHSQPEGKAMAYFAVFYEELVENYVERRNAFREEHLRLAREWHARGELLLGGALAEPADGALLIFKAKDAETVLEFVRCDPYVLNGLVQRWRVRPWTVVVGNP
jgi:uncharacterized protein YciI